MSHISTSRKRNGGVGDGADSFSVTEHRRSDTAAKVPHISHGKPHLTSLIRMKRIAGPLKAKRVKLQRNRSRTQKPSISPLKAEAAGQAIEDSVTSQPAALLGKHQTDTVWFHQLRNRCPVDPYPNPGVSSSAQRHLSALLPLE